MMENRLIPVIMDEIDMGWSVRSDYGRRQVWIVMVAGCVDVEVDGNVVGTLGGNLPFEADESEEI